jgi:uncharacterized protein YdaU (DUF1376 family)
MSALPYMPFYPSDYLGDTHHLSTVEHGAYFLLLITYWVRGEALPNDDERLARITKLSLREWKKVRLAVEEFFVIDGHLWMHKRVELDLAHARNKVALAAKAGRASAERRRNGRSNGRSSERHNGRSNGRATISEPEYITPLTPQSCEGAAPALSGGRAAPASDEGALPIGDILSSMRKDD